MKLYFAPKWIPAVCIAVLGLSACKKDPSKPKKEVVAAVTAKGVPDGQATQATIGAAGGSLTSADGKVTVTVAPGTLTADLQFGIQPITNTLNETPGLKNYRLTPEGTTFSKPIEVTFNYTDEDVKGSSPEYLTVAYQTPEGKWQAVPGRVNAAGRQFSFKTTHFSDWSFDKMITLIASKTLVEFGETVQLEIKELYMDDSGMLAPLGPPDDYGNINSIEWSVINDFGAVTYDANDKAKASYTPDHPKGPKSKGEIKVQLDGEMKIKREDGSGRDVFKQMILLIDIDVLGTVYMEGSFGETIRLEENVTALLSGGRITINGHTPTMSISLQAFAFRAGNYDAGDINEIDKSLAIVVGHGNTPFSYSSTYRQCEPPKNLYSGSLTITKWGNVGEPVEGSFGGTLRMFDATVNGCPTYKTRSLNVKFKTVRSL